MPQVSEPGPAATVPAAIPVAALSAAWMARFIENGISLDDYRRVTAEVTQWPQWCAAWSAAAARHEADAEAAEAAGRATTGSEQRLLAAVTYHFAKFVFTHDLEQLRAAHDKAVANYRAGVGGAAYPGELVNIAYGSAVLRGVLRLPDASGAPHPVVIMVPGLDATKEEMHRFCEVFLRRGLATVCCDGPGQGEAEFDLPIRPDWEAVASPVVDFVATRPELDADRIGLAGVSLGGYYAARAAAVETRLRAAASIGGCYDLTSCWTQLPELTKRAFALRSHSTDWDETLRKAGEIDLDAVPAIERPFLVVHGGRDLLFDVTHAKRLLAKAGDYGVLIDEPTGDHVCHNLAYRVRPAVADWLVEKLAAR